VFQENLTETHSINAISKILKKSYPNINKKSNFLIKEGVLGKIILGKSYQCYLNLNNDKTKIFVAINEINKRESFIDKNKIFQNVLEELLQLDKKFKIKTALLHKKNIILVMENLESKKEILNLSMLTKDFNIVFFDTYSFQEYFLEHGDLQKYHCVLLNTENYVNMISELFEKLLIKRLVGNNGK